MFSAGADVAVGLRSPSDRWLEVGDAGIAAIGLWGGNCARGGIVAASESDARDGYLERMAVAEEARDVCPPYEQVQTTVSAEAEVTRE